MEFEDWEVNDDLWLAEADEGKVSPWELGAGEGVGAGGGEQHGQ